MRMLLLCALPLFAATATTPLPTTWDEPWHEDVIRNAVSFAKVEVLENKKGAAVHAKLLELVAGAAVPKTFVLDHYSMLRRLSSSSFSDEELFRQRKGAVGYVFLADPKPGGGYAVATPTSGWASLTDGNVRAVYRHSYHQAQVPEALYRDTQRAMFAALHGGAPDTKFVRQLFDTWLKQAPQAPADDPDQCATFFAQHAALECFRCLGTAADRELLEPFLRHDSYHVQISAVRALARIDTEEARARLFAFLTGGGEGFAKVMAVWGLRQLGAREYKDKLKAWLPEAPEQETGFGGGLMDPRIGTRFPRSVKAAVEELLAEWEKAPAEKPR